MRVVGRGSGRRWERMVRRRSGRRWEGVAGVADGQGSMPQTSSPPTYTVILSASAYEVPDPWL